MRKPKLLPKSLALRDLQRLDDLAQEVESKVSVRTTQVIHIGQSAGIRSMGKPIAVTSGAVIAGAIAGNKFSESWRRRVMRAVIGGSSNPATEAAKALSARLDTIAITESAKAFNEARQAAADRIEPARDMVIIKRWDAELDNRTCDFCGAQDGKVVLASDSFSGGDPGEVHPRCRCVAQYEEISRFEYSMLVA